MTSPQPNNMQFLDVNNPLLAAGPARIDTGIIEHPETGRIGVFTLRTSSSTNTALIGADDLRNWADHITALADALDGGGSKLVSASPLDVQTLDTTMQRRTR
jgi:hypothetical protein